MAGSVSRRRTTAAPPCCSAAPARNLTALLSAHQSIGVPQPLLLFGTDEQKQRFLPRVAGGEISAFALTESNVGSDPAKMETRAEPTPDGRHFIVNGEKLWCTNGTRAGIIVVMAKTPPKDGPEARSPRSSSRWTCPALRSCIAATSWVCARSTMA